MLYHKYTYEQNLTSTAFHNFQIKKLIKITIIVIKYPFFTTKTSHYLFSSFLFGAARNFCHTVFITVIPSLQYLISHFLLYFLSCKFNSHKGYHYFLKNFNQGNSQFQILTPLPFWRHHPTTPTHIFPMTIYNSIDFNKNMRNLLNSFKQVEKIKLQSTH